MRFLLPVGGVVDHRFGILTAPTHMGIPVGIVADMEWAADLGCLDGPDFVKRFDPLTAFPWLCAMWKYRKTCLFVLLPDFVGDAKRTLEMWYRLRVLFIGWPLAFVAQDGQEDLEFPDPVLWSALFIGGSTFWKCSDGAMTCIKRAQALGKHIHIGRVNWRDRYRLFRGLEGSDEFTCDGTRTRYDGTENTVRAWLDLMDELPPTVESWPIRLPGF